LPTVSIPSIAFTPTSNCSLIGGRFKGFGGSFSVGTVVNPFGNGCPSNGLPIASSTFPISSGPTFTSSGEPVPSTRQPIEISFNEEYGIKITISSLNPTTSASITCGPFFDVWIWILHTSPMELSGPWDSIIKPTTLDTLPYFLNVLRLGICSTN